MGRRGNSAARSPDGSGQSKSGRPSSTPLPGRAMHLRCHNVVMTGARRTGQAAREAHGSWQYQRKVSVRTLARPMGPMVRKSNAVLPRGSNHTFQQAKRMRARKKALQHVLQGLQTLVGAAGFELATLCSQSRCATRLRYAPTARILTRQFPCFWFNACFL